MTTDIIHFDFKTRKSLIERMTASRKLLHFYQRTEGLNGQICVGNELEKLLKICPERKTPTISSLIRRI